MNTSKKNTNIGLLTLRLCLGILLLFHGIANLNTGYSFIKSLLNNYHIPSILAYGVFIGEIIAPILILIGFKTQLASLTIAINMLVAILLAHSSEILSLNQFGGWAIELQVLYLFLAISLTFLGSGKYILPIKSI